MGPAHCTRPTPPGRALVQLRLVGQRRRSNGGWGAPRLSHRDVRGRQFLQKHVCPFRVVAPRGGGLERRDQGVGSDGGGVRGVPGLFTSAAGPLGCHLESRPHRMVEAPGTRVCREQGTSHPSAREEPPSPPVTHVERAAVYADLRTSPGPHEDGETETEGLP